VKKLLETIRKDRFRQKVRKPWPETTAAVVAAIVQKYELMAIPGEWVNAAENPREAKPAGRMSLLPLATAAQWRLTKEIMAQYDNPYLVFARSPEDISLSRRLYERNPGLAPEVLQEQSLEALWVKEIFRQVNEGLPQ
jgi:hypothetical protein